MRFSIWSNLDSNVRIADVVSLVTLSRVKLGNSASSIATLHLTVDISMQLPVACCLA